MKTFEEIHRCAAADAPAWLAERDERRRGEFVIAIDRIAEVEASTAPQGVLAPEHLLPRLLPAYRELLGRLAAIGVAQGRPVPAQLRGHKIVLGDQDQLVLPLEVGDHLFVRLG